MSKEFNTKTILNAITDYSADKGNTLNDIRYSTFCLDPWIMGTYQAIKALKDFNEQDQLYEKTEQNGLSGAIQYAHDYARIEFGKFGFNIDSSDPEHLASTIAYINGEQIINKLADKLNLELDDELTEQQAAMLSSVESMQELLKK